MKYRLLILFFIFFSVSPLVMADYYDFPDLYDAKLLLKDKLLGGALDLFTTPGEIFNLENNRKAKFMVIQKNKDNEKFLFASFLMNDFGSYPLSKQGNISLKRNLENGGFEYYTLILRDEEGCYLRMTPDENRTICDIYLFGTPLYRNLFIPIPFQQAVFLRFSEIRRLLEKNVDWDFLLYHERTFQHTYSEKLAGDIQMQLSFLGDNDDGAIDENGNWVYIQNLKAQKENLGLNCSGFAKWVVDGFYHELTGRNMKIDLLKQPHPERRGNRWTRNLEEEFDLYFGLDWIRNIAYQYHSKTNPLSVSQDIEAYDVDDVPLVNYVEDVGYKMDQLYLALFYLAQKDQGNIYLGAINRPWDMNPQLLIYFHVVVLIPYFDEHGHFQVVLLERQENNQVKNLDSRYPHNYIHLVRINVEHEYSYKGYR